MTFKAFAKKTRLVTIYVLIASLILLRVNSGTAKASEAIISSAPSTSSQENDPWWVIALTIVGAVAGAVYLAEKIHENTSTADAFAEAVADENHPPPKENSAYPPAQIATADTGLLTGQRGSKARAKIISTNGFEDFKRAYDKD